MGVSVCSLQLRTADDPLILAAQDGVRPPETGEGREQLIDLIATGQRPVNTRRTTEGKPDESLAFLGVPVVHLGHLVGVLLVERPQKRKFKPSEEAFLITVAAQIGHAVPDAVDPALGTPEGSYHIEGVAGSPGVGIGVTRIVSHDATPLPAYQSTDPASENARFRRAAESTLEEFSAGRNQMAPNVGRDILAVFEVYEQLLQCDEFSGSIERAISGGHSAMEALHATANALAARFEAMDDPYLRSRAEDIHHLARRVARHLSSLDSTGEEVVREPTVLVGTLVGVAELAAIPRSVLAGIVCTEGSALSHTAVLAAALGVPAVMATGSIPNLSDGATAIVDGSNGRVFFSPPDDVVAEYRAVAEQDESLDQDLASLVDSPAVTPDGHRVNLLANTGLLADVTPGLERGAEGIGLYRSEMPFLAQDTFPTEDEQFEVYRSVLRAYEGKPVLMRTLDVGGDKQLPYYRYAEENPALGWRGIRFSLDNSAIFLTQLRAMLRASVESDNLRLLLPMLSCMEEFDAFEELLATAIGQLNDQDCPAERPPVGIMVEVPAAITLLPMLAPKIQFISIGTNDLSQYLLAVDRTNAKVSRLFDHLHPAVIQRVHEIMAAAKTLELPVCLCGEMAADPLAVVLLLGMGIESLSLSAHAIPRIKYLIREISQKEAVEQLVQALTHSKASGLRDQIVDFLSTKESTRVILGNRRPTDSAAMEELTSVGDANCNTLVLR